MLEPANDSLEQLHITYEKATEDQSTVLATVSSSSSSAQQISETIATNQTISIIVRSTRIVAVAEGLKTDRITNEFVQKKLIESI